MLYTEKSISTARRLIAAIAIQNNLLLIKKHPLSPDEDSLILQNITHPDAYNYSDICRGSRNGVA